MRWWLPLLFWPLLAAQAQVQSPVIATTTRGDTIFATIAFDSVRLKQDTVLVTRVDTIIRSLPSFAPRKIGFGPTALPVDSLGLKYTATILGGNRPWESLPTVRAKGGTVVLYLARSKSRVKTASGDTVISVKAAKAFLDTWPDISSYVADGTVWGIMVSDDIYGKEIWGPGAPYFAEIDSIALYVKRRWPGVRTIVREQPSEATYPWRWVRWTWATYGAAPRYGEVLPFRDKERAAADSLGMCLIFALNVLHGGDGSSGIAYPRQYRTAYEMSNAEIVTYAKALLPYTPIFVDYQYRPEVELRIKDARTKVRQMADTIPAPSCS